MPHLWLRVAVACYGLGLLYALIALNRKREFLTRIVLHAVGVGVTFHLVSLVEFAARSGHVVPVSTHYAESFLAFFVVLFFFGIYWRYKTTSHGIFVFPLVFVLSLSASIGQDPPQFTSPMFRSGWLFGHIALIFAGYTALLFSFVSSLLYLTQERVLKSKQIDGVLGGLPPLEVIDEIGYRSLMIGFPFMTLGLVAGAVIAQLTFGPMYFMDPKVALSLFMWVVYSVLLFMRWSAGWRGRNAALLTTVAFVAAAFAWAANFISTTHGFISQ